MLVTAEENKTNPWCVQSRAESQQGVGTEVKVVAVCYELQIGAHSCCSLCVCHKRAV